MDRLKFAGFGGRRAAVRLLSEPPIAIATGGGLGASLGLPTGVANCRRTEGAAIGRSTGAVGRLTGGLLNALATLTGGGAATVGARTSGLAMEGAGTTVVGRTAADGRMGYNGRTTEGGLTSAGGETIP